VNGDSGALSSEIHISNLYYQKYEILKLLGIMGFTNLSFIYSSNTHNGHSHEFISVVIQDGIKTSQELIT
jgi:hypothetical protein